MKNLSEKVEFKYGWACWRIAYSEIIANLLEYKHGGGTGASLLYSAMRNGGYHENMVHITTDLTEEFLLKYDDRHGSNWACGPEYNSALKEFVTGKINHLYRQTNKSCL